MDNNVYVFDYVNKRIVKLSGMYKLIWGKGTLHLLLHPNIFISNYYKLIEPENNRIEIVRRPKRFNNSIDNKIKYCTLYF